ncbi:nuclear transport factor 2 family protein [Bradyrhizobium sp. S3.2.12]|uniref:nuclear transport factor 2 family protein n=1 Tax=unclassified Bradyrhizobium TaxID=2631580 RepID=UPI0033923DB9
MAFDPMAAAVDWLDAYRAGDFETILQMYADDAVTECGCDNVTIGGRESLRSYWVRRLKEYPASRLDDLKPSEDGATVLYLARDRMVSASLEFDEGGRIAVLRCWPMK